MSKNNSNFGIYATLGGVLLAIAFGTTGAIVYSKRKRQSEFDELMRVINANATSTSQAEEKGSGFDIDLYKKNPKCVSITPSEAKNYANNLYKAKGTINDDEEAVETFFRVVKSKCDLSRVADAFYGIYKTDLLLHLKSFLSEKELENIVYKYSNKLK